MIYSRIQYLLPWGLYAFHELIAREAARRGIPYEDDIQKLAYLADEGVPSFDALRLTAHGFERVDATRLARAYHGAGGHSSGVDIVGWLLATPMAELARYAAGVDRRRLDYDFKTLVGHA